MQNVRRDVSVPGGRQFRNAPGYGGACKLRKLLFGSRSGPHNERPSRSATVTNRKLSRCLLPSLLRLGPGGSPVNLVENLPSRSSTPFDPRTAPPLFFLTLFTPETARAQRTVARVKLYLRASGSLKVHFIKDLRDYSRNRRFVGWSEKGGSRRGSEGREWRRRESLLCGSATTLLTYTFVAELKARRVSACIRLELY